MTPEQIQIVRLTFAQAMDHKLEIGKMFYERLFVIAPETRAMFSTDIESQSRKLMDTLAFAISSLREVPELVGMLEALARRHVEYGVRDEHYAKVGEALLWTLDKTFGAAFTTEVREAWTSLYTLVADTMLNANRQNSRQSSRPASA